LTGPKKGYRQGFNHRWKGTVLKEDGRDQNVNGIQEVHQIDITVGCERRGLQKPWQMKINIL